MDMSALTCSPGAQPGSSRRLRPAQLALPSALILLSLPIAYRFA